MELEMKNLEILDLTKPGDESYFIDVVCINCDWKGKTKIKKGEKLPINQKCPYCENTFTLKKQFIPEEKMKRYKKEKEYEDGLEYAINLCEVGSHQVQIIKEKLEKLSEIIRKDIVINQNDLLAINANSLDNLKLGINGNILESERLVDGTFIIKKVLFKSVSIIDGDSREIKRVELKP